MRVTESQVVPLVQTIILRIQLVILERIICPLWFQVRTIYHRFRLQTIYHRLQAQTIYHRFLVQIIYHRFQVQIFSHRF